MSNKKNQSTKPDQPSDNRQPEAKQSTQDNIVDVMDLVYAGGYDRDPQEILGNPAVAPEMLSDGRDLRPDLFREAEEAAPNDKEAE
ncbi:hypothetical protein IFO70_06610 [Phormidium tenue FACHB-886]|nr:hypothetical protein [Phormidium tenue FACHB-886]